MMTVGLFKRLISEDNPNLKPGMIKNQRERCFDWDSKYNFEIHGNSGITHGDTFNIIGIPMYIQKQIFQITNVEHSVNQMVWTNLLKSI